jgi:hypothetical protein
MLRLIVRFRLTVQRVSGFKILVRVGVSVLFVLIVNSLLFCGIIRLFVMLIHIGLGHLGIGHRIIGCRAIVTPLRVRVQDVPGHDKVFPLRRVELHHLEFFSDLGVFLEMVQN